MAVISRAGKESVVAVDDPLRGKLPVLAAVPLLVFLWVGLLVWFVAHTGTSKDVSLVLPQLINALADIQPPKGAVTSGALNKHAKSNSAFVEQEYLARASRESVISSYESELHQKGWVEKYRQGVQAPKVIKYCKGGERYMVSLQLKEPPAPFETGYVLSIVWSTESEQLCSQAAT